jgi:hypothetical protein
MFFVQTSTLPPRMHQKLTKYGRFSKHNNQLPTKSHDELEDSSIISNIENLVFNYQGFEASESCKNKKN